MKLKPLNQNIVVRKLEGPKTSPGGVTLLNDNAQPQAEVLFVGDNVDVEVGDIILYSRRDGVEIKEGGEELLVLHNSQVICVLG